MRIRNRFLCLFKNNIISQKGMALMATLIFVFVLTTLGIALLTMTRSEIKLSALQVQSTKAFYLADAGIEKALNWLETFSTPPTQENIDATNFDGNYEYGELNTGKYTVELSISGLGGLAARYIIKAEGLVTRPDNSRVSRKIETLVKVLNFAEYAYFSDDERFPNNPKIPDSSGYVGAKIWFIGDDILGGKVHSNSQFHMVDVPKFFGKLTSTADTIDFWGDAYDEDGSDFPGFFPFTPPPSGDYELGVDIIPLPQYRNISDLDDEYSLQRIAGGSWGKLVIEGLSNGVYVPNDGSANPIVTGGIYIQGNANIELNVDLVTGGSGPNSQITVNQGGNTTIITSVRQPFELPSGSFLNGEEAGGANIPANTTLLEVDTNTYESYNGITNGLLFVDGNINSLQGGNHKGKMTIAANESINITGDLLYESRNIPELIDLDVNEFDEADMANIVDSLGLVAAKDVVIDWNAPYHIEVDAIIMAIDTSFFYDGWRDVPQGTLNLLGGLIQKERGPVGTHSAGTKITGYSKNYYYDIRMSNPAGGYLPPYFPTTGKYEKVYWKEVY